MNTQRPAATRKGRQTVGRQTPQEEPPEIELKPSPTAPRKRLTSPRTTDPNRQGKGQIHRIVSNRETASTDDPFKTTDFTSQAYDPIVDEALTDAHIPPHATRIHTTASHLLPRFPSPTDAPGPDRSVQRPNASATFRQACPVQAGMYDAVTSSDKPNFLGAQVPVQHALNIQAWRKYQHLLEDQTLVPKLEFGFPVGYMGNQPPDTKATNHSSATNFPSHVDKFIELEHKAIMGPFENSPFSPWYRTNPLMTRPKRDSQDRRVILDLSYPEGASVNAQILCQSLLNATFNLRLPTPKQLADRIMTLGPGCHLFKIDLSRAYRQLRSDPRDWPFLGISWTGGRNVDAAIPFGLRHGASACQRTSEAVSTITFHKCQAVTLPYVDDTACSSLPHQSQAHYRGTLETMDELGLQVAPAEMEWIGVNYNTVDMTMQIAPAKVAEAAGMCRAFLASISMTRHEMQSFMGKVLHATKCTMAAR